MSTADVTGKFEIYQETNVRDEVKKVSKVRFICFVMRLAILEIYLKILLFYFVDVSAKRYLQ